jgi:hypothetical protein
MTIEELVSGALLLAAIFGGIVLWAVCNPSQEVYY